LVDGLIALGDYPKIMKTLLLGQDTVTIDNVCSRIMGFNPRGVEYIRLAENEGMRKRYKFIGEASLEELKRLFPQVGYWRQRITWGLQLWMVNMYAADTLKKLEPQCQRPLKS